MGRLSRAGEFDLCLGGFRKIEKEVLGFQLSVFPGGKVANSYKHVLARWKGLIDVIKTFVSDWFPKKCL